VLKQIAKNYTTAVVKQSALNTATTVLTLSALTTTTTTVRGATRDLCQGVLKFFSSTNIGKQVIFDPSSPGQLEEEGWRRRFWGNFSQEGHF